MIRKMYVLLGTLLVCLCGGCAEDPNDTLVARTVMALNTTTSKIEEVKRDVSEGVAQAKKESKPLSVSYLKKASDKALDLKKIAQQLQSFKAESDVRKESLNSEQKAALADKHKTAFQAAMQRIDKAQRELDAALAEADTSAATISDTDERAKVTAAMTDLRKKLDDSQREFEVLTKRQS